MKAILIRASSGRAARREKELPLVAREEYGSFVQFAAVSRWVAMMGAVVLCASCIAPPSPPAPAGSAVTDVLRYDVEASIDPVRREIRARAVISIPPSDMLSSTEVGLDANSAGSDARGARLRLDRAAEGDGAPLPLEADAARRLVVVRFRRPAPSGKPVKLALYYTVRLDDAQRKTIGYDALPSSASDDLWYPAIVGARPGRGRFHDFRVRLTYPRGHAVLTSGLLSGEVASSGEELRATYESSHVEGFALNIGEGFVLTRAKEGDVEITAFHPRSLTTELHKALALTAEAVVWYRRTYGFFPVRHLGIAPFHPKWRGGFPTANLFYIHLGDLSSPHLKEITAHELGHYYWGHHVLSDAPEVLDWLMLGNGIWADHLFLAQSTGRQLEEVWRDGDWFTRYMKSVLTGKERALGIPRAAEEQLDFDYNSDVRHAKGAIGVYLQARRLGVGRFVELQRSLLAEYAHRPLPPGEFAGRLEAAGAPGAVQFFERFARGDAMLGFAVGGVGRSGDGRYRVEMLRTGNLVYPVTIEVRSDLGDVVRLDVPGESTREAVFPPLRGQPTEVRIDPDGALPLPNGAHHGVRRAFSRALATAGLTEAFDAWSRRLLWSQPDDDEVRSLLAEQLLRRGRARDVIELVRGRVSNGCDSGAACRGALHLARAYHLSGDAEHARVVIALVEAGCVRFELRAQWEQARAALAQH